MNRFFLPETTARPGQPLGAGAEVAFAAEDASHIARVLRLGPGDEVIGVLHGWEYRVRLTEASVRHVAGVVIAGRQGESEPPLRVLVAQGMPKADKFEWVVQKATELGAAGIVAVQCERSVVKLQQERAGKRLERWQKIAREGAQQSARVAVPTVLPPCSWQHALALGGPHTVRLVPWEGEQALGLAEALSGAKPPGRPDAQGAAAAGDWDVIIYIGPEGGLSAREIAAARDAGAVPVTLGPRILRTETAALAALTLVLGAWGDLGRSGPGGSAGSGSGGSAGRIPGGNVGARQGIPPTAGE